MIFADASTLMFWPMFAMVSLTATAWALMGRRRLGAISRGEVPLEDFKGHKEPGMPAEASVATRHFANHFEIPLLFHLACLLHVVYAVGSYLAAGLAWAFVLLRGLHTREHLGRNDVRSRFRFYAASTILVWVLWLELAVRLAVS